MLLSLEAVFPPNINYINIIKLKGNQQAYDELAIFLHLYALKNICLRTISGFHNNKMQAYILEAINRNEKLENIASLIIANVTAGLISLLAITIIPAININATASYIIIVGTISLSLILCNYLNHLRCKQKENSLNYFLHNSKDKTTLLDAEQGENNSLLFSQHAKMPETYINNDCSSKSIAAGNNHAVFTQAIKRCDNDDELKAIQLGLEAWDTMDPTIAWQYKARKYSRGYYFGNHYPTSSETQQQCLEIIKDKLQTITI